MVIASIFDNKIRSGFENTFLVTLPDTDVAGVILDETTEHFTPSVVIRNSDFLALFTSGKIIGQQVLLPFAHDAPSAALDAGENPARAAIVDALKAGRLPQPVHFNPVFYNNIGAHLVVPASLVP